MSSNVNQTIPRATGLLIIEVRNSNPNGDPDRESDPRRRSHDQRGVISGVSFKRKLRHLVHEKEGPVWKEMRSRLQIDRGQLGRQLGSDFLFLTIFFLP